MKISTVSIVVGSSSCDASCPFCVSHTTGFEQLTNDGIDWQAFSQAISLARQAGTTTLLLTGKGEPCLYPNEITAYLRALYALGEEREFINPKNGGETLRVHKPVISLIELQTNGIRLGMLAAKAIFAQDNAGAVSIQTTSMTPDEQKFFGILQEWKQLGLRTIALSTVGVRKDWNQRVYLHHRRGVEYPDLALTIKFLHAIGFKIRLSVMMQKGMVAAPSELDETIRWCKTNNVDQLTVRPIRRPDGVPQNDFERYVDRFGLDGGQEDAIRSWLQRSGDRIHTLTMGNHQAPVYDVDGQNVCMADCLTVDCEPDTIRTLILYPRGGQIAYSWVFMGAKL